MILVSLIAIMSNIFIAIPEMMKFIKIYEENMDLYETGRAICFVSYFNVVPFVSVIIFR